MPAQLQLPQQTGYKQAAPPTLELIELPDPSQSVKIPRNAPLAQPGEGHPCLSCHNTTVGIHRKSAMPVPTSVSIVARVAPKAIAKVPRAQPEPRNRDLNRPLPIAAQSGPSRARPIGRQGQGVCAFFENMKARNFAI